MTRLELKKRDLCQALGSYCLYRTYPVVIGMRGMRRCGLNANLEIGGFSRALEIGGRTECKLKGMIYTFF